MALVAAATSALGLISPYFGKQLFDQGISAKNPTVIIQYGLFSLLALALATSLRFTSRALYARVNNRFSLVLKGDIMTRLVSLPMAFFDKQRSGYLAGRVSETNTVAGLFSPTLFQFVASIFQGAGALVICLRLNAQVTLIMLPFLIVIGATISWMSRKMRLSTHDLMEQSASNSGIMQEIVFGIKDIKNYDPQNQKLSQALKQYGDIAEKRVKQTTFISGGTEFLVFNTSFVGVVLMVTIGLFVARDQLTIGDYVALSGYSVQILSPVQLFSGVMMTIQPILVSLKRMRIFFETKSERELCGSRKLARIQGEVSFSGVSFSYDENKPMVLSDCSFSVFPGESMVILGRNGSGKSTILKLMLGLYQQYSGTIEIDGVNLKELDTISLRDHIGIISQNTFLFHGSLLENLRMAAPQASLADIERAAELSGCKAVFGNYLEVQVEEFGRNLSGGQKQAASIARCLLKNPDLLLCDEATTHLDAQTRQLVLTAIKDVFSDKTRIIITHDSQVANIADRVLLLEEGRIREVDRTTSLKMSAEPATAEQMG